MTGKKIFIILASALIFMARVSIAEDLCLQPVKTDSGLVRGASEAGTRTCVWRGVPYAAPPVNGLRWKAPQPVKPWSGVREASTWGHRCMQAGFLEKINYDPSGGMSEDCLYLNIWRPDPAKRGTGKFPVMVWIHGGAYTGGTANTPMYWGDRLSESGAVLVVSFNYRLNVFGFLALPALAREDPNQSAGNYGSLDQVAALKWVQKNIANFGGDPDNVTIFGESAGGISVFNLIASPLGKGLFRRAIVQSGRSDASLSLEKGFADGMAISKKLGCKPDDINCLRKLSAEKLLEVFTGVGFTESALQPHHDRYFLKDTARAVINSGNYNRVPVLAGSNKNEIDVFLTLRGDLWNARPEDYGKRVQEFLGVPALDSEKFQGAYPLVRYGGLPRNAFAQMATDFRIACPTYYGLAAASKYQNQLYYYRFDFRDIRLGEYLGAMHTLEIPFVFNTLDRPPMKTLLKNKQTKEMTKLSAVVQGYWVSFARTGNPNRPGLPEWPEFTQESQALMVLDKSVRAMPSTIAGRCALWDDYSRKHPGKIDILSKPKKN